MAKEWKWGYISRTGEVVIAPRFDDAWDFHEGLAAIKIDWARGYIDKTGAFVIEPRFENAGPFVDGVACVVEDGTTRYIDRQGHYVEAPERDMKDLCRAPAPDESLLKKYYDAGGYSEGLAPVKKSASGKWGFADEEGRLVIPSHFRQTGNFHDGLAPVLLQI